jgi:hypothetical protein
MKTMPRKQLGGKCDQTLSAETWQMVQAMTKHVVVQHPDVAKEMGQRNEAEMGFGIPGRSKSKEANAKVKNPYQHWVLSAFY